MRWSDFTGSKLQRADRLGLMVRIGRGRIYTHRMVRAYVRRNKWPLRLRYDCWRRPIRLWHAVAYNISIALESRVSVGILNSRWESRFLSF